MSLLSFSHVGESINHSFYLLLQAAICVILSQLMWTQTMLFFNSVVDATREEKTKEKMSKIGAIVCCQ